MEMSPSYELKPIEEEPIGKRLARRKRRSTVIPKVCFSRLVHEIATKYSKDKVIWNHQAMKDLHEFVETYLEQYFRMGNNLAGLCKKSTITPEIFEFIEKYKGDLVVF